VQQGRLIAVTGQAGAKAKFRHSIPVELSTLPGAAENVEFKPPAGLND
jgi:hypothetical protein